MFIRRLSGAIVPLRVYSINDSVYTAKMKIQEKTGVAAEQQRLVHSGRTLSDHYNFKMYDIHFGDTIYLVLKSGGKTSKLVSQQADLHCM